MSPVVQRKKCSPSCAAFQRAKRAAEHAELLCSLPHRPSSNPFLCPSIYNPGCNTPGNRCSSRCSPSGPADLLCSRAAAPGSSRDGAQPCGQRRSRRCRFQENGRLFPAEQVRRSGAERVTLSSLTPWQRGHGVSICHPFGCCWGGRAEDRLGTALPEGCAPFLL